MDLAHSLPIRPCHKISQVGTLWNTGATFATPSIASKRAGRQSIRVAHDHFHVGPLEAGRLPNPMSFRSTNMGFALVPRCTQSSEEGDHRASETGHRIHKAIKNRNLNELSDAVGEQVLNSFSTLMRALANSISIVIHPTPKGGMNIGLSWHLEQEQPYAPFGTEFSFLLHHVYHGKLMAREVHLLNESVGPLIHGFTQWKMLGFLGPILHKISSTTSKGRKAFVYWFLTVGFMTTLFMAVKYSLF